MPWTIGLFGHTTSVFMCSRGVTLQGIIFTVRNEVAKVMFLHLSVILCTGGAVCLSACWDTTPPQKHTSLESIPPSTPGKYPPGDDCRCGLYASYWNAFLLRNNLPGGEGSGTSRLRRMHQLFSIIEIFTVCKIEITMK